jgi:hypothetical protein
MGGAPTTRLVPELPTLPTVKDIKKRIPQPVKNARRWPERTYRMATADRRAMPSYIILGTQRGGTTSLYEWLITHPDIEPAYQKEVHYFDWEYHRGMNWYKSFFPYESPGKITGEASPYMLPYLVSAERALKDLPETTKFIALLREPVQRAVSHYFLERRLGLEPLSFEQAIAIEGERLKGAEAVARSGEQHYNHRHFSYKMRGEYARQLRHWFDVVGRERILVLESEKIYTDKAAADAVTDFLEVPRYAKPVPSLNAATRLDSLDPNVLAGMHDHFKDLNEELFELLGRRLWDDDVPEAATG